MKVLRNGAHGLLRVPLARVCPTPQWTRCLRPQAKLYPALYSGPYRSFHASPHLLIYRAPRKVQIPEQEAEEEEPRSSPRRRRRRKQRTVKTTDPPLSKDQKAALQRAKDGKNLFITGRAGTGKTVLIRAIKRWAEGKKTVHVTSPTGAAALLIDGTTIHAWAGVGLGEKPVDYYIKLAKKQEAFVETDLLIIDEISMVQPRLFELIDMLAKEFRNSTEPFGGMQVLVCGDFFQLPPIEHRIEDCLRCGTKLLDMFHDTSSKHLSVLPEDIHEHDVDPGRWKLCHECFHPDNDTIKYVFQTRTWLEAGFETVVLEKVHRQTNKEWADHLVRIGRGEIGEDTLDYLEALNRPLPTLHGIKPTLLYARRADVDRENKKELELLPHPKHTFEAFDTVTTWEEVCGESEVHEESEEMLEEYQESHWKRLEQERLGNEDLDLPEYKRYFGQLQCRSESDLKAGAQVMLLVNKHDDKLVNGSRGVITRFEKFSRSEYLDLAPPKISDPQEKEHYLEGLLLYFNRNACPESDDIFIPRVRFLQGTGKGNAEEEEEEEKEDIPIFPHLWNRKETITGEDGNNYLRELQRVQIPLALAWAATIHKSQGQTLDYAIADIAQSFAPGQAYVALSRCKSPENLQIKMGPGGRHGLKKALMVAPQVRRYYERLEAFKNRVQEGKRVKLLDGAVPVGVASRGDKLSGDVTAATVGAASEGDRLSVGAVTVPVRKSSSFGASLYKIK